jgi:SAM-dependent methyltransferase
MEAVELWRLFRREREDPEPFYALLAERAADDLERRHGPLAGRHVVDVGCGPGFYTRELRARGATVTPVDADEAELTLAGDPPDGAIVADAADLPLETASVDGVFCSNMLEHTPDPFGVVREAERVLRPGGWLYLSWTNWFSPWGGHEIVPYHFLGPRLGPRVYERRHGRPRKNVPGEGLFPLHVGQMLRFVRGRERLRVDRVEPRYWPRLRVIAAVPGAREVLMWNCVIRATRLP